MRKQSDSMLGRVLAEAESLGTYDVGETIEGLARRLCKKPSEVLKLNSNENFFVPLSFIRSALKEVVEEVDPRIYPRDEPKELKEALSRYVNASPEEIVIGTGSDQLIDLVSRMLLRRGDEALSIFPTFSIYKRCVQIQGAGYKAVPLKEDFSLDTEKILAAVTPRTKVIFLCSPNNPTANQFSRREVKRLVESFRGLVAVDEAYVDFSSSSIVDLIRGFENLVVFRTFSKVFGLAGLRVGCAIANPEFAEVMDERYQMPYSVTLVALKAALKLLEKSDVIRSAVEGVKAERGRLVERLDGVGGVRAFDSDANFVLFQAQKSSNAVYDALLGKGVIVRNIGRVLNFENCLRVTVAPSPMMERFLTALGEVLG
ncbi:MAG: histidinol-phosphate transaminase [Candidatus Bathyarchaeota archaeon]|nr:histidinol-phosphate transaminase [Candidatus Bathyarchaeota archaeon]